MSDYLDPNNEELLKDFYSEAQMQVELMEQNILALEDDPKDQDAIDEIFRAAHTLKGGAATVQMEELSSFTHILEDLLDAIRGGEVKVSGENVDVLLSSIDIIKAMLASRRNGLVYDEDISGVRANLEMMIAKKEDIKPVEPKPMDKVAQPVPSAKTENEDVQLSEYEKLEMAEAAGSGERVVRVRVTFDESNPMNTVGGIQVFAKLKDLGQIMKTVPDFDALYEDMFHPVVDYYLSTKEDPDQLESSVAISDVTVSVHVGGLDEEPEGMPAPEPVSTPAAEQVEEVKEVEEVEELTALVPEPPGPESSKPLNEAPTSSFKKETSSGSVLRVDSQRIDNLLNLVSESVINKATFNQISTQFNEILTELNTAEGTYKDGLKGLFESLPQWLEQIKEGRAVKEIKSEINELYGGLYSAFDSFESNLKS
ncbi:MAG: Hpt domain-containing protein, partial [Spirochaetaceae bacterium]|nr:Hpt domain-containing protein [Spirochaetaceae bacterium]